MLEQYGDDFIPNLNVEWDDIELEHCCLVQTWKHVGLSMCLHSHARSKVSMQDIDRDRC